MGKQARIKRERREGRVTVDRLRAIEARWLEELRPDTDCSLTLVRCEACSTVQSNVKEAGCALCRGAVARYA